MPVPAPTQVRTVIALDRIAQRIHLIRGQRGTLGPDQFPKDFMFQLTSEDMALLKSQSVISSQGWGGGRHAPYDARFRVVFDAIRQLMEPADATRPRPEIGFRSEVRRRMESRG